MHFPNAFKVILLCLTVSCNGQFKIIGLLNSESDNSDGTLEKIRSLDEVSEKFPPHENISEGRGFAQTINATESVNVSKEKVNFIKPYDVTTNDLKKDFVDATSEASSAVNDANKVLMPGESTYDEDLNGHDIGAAIVSEHFSDVEITSNLPPGSPTSISKSYRSECEA